MRLTTRLESLENDEPSAGLTRDESMFLVSILARRDALYWPWRWLPDSTTPFAEIRRRQREYLDGGHGLSAKADGRQQWKAVHFMRQKLLTGGYITANRSGGQVTDVFLTSFGEATARALVGDRLYTFDRSRIVLAMILVGCQEQKTTAVSESQLFGRELIGCPHNWDDDTEMVLPLLCCGIVEAESDTEGRVIYIPKVETVAEPETVTVDDIESDEEFDSSYVQTFNSTRTVLESTEPRDPHEIVIPNPRGWPWLND